MIDKTEAVNVHARQFTVSLAHLGIFALPFLIQFQSNLVHSW